MSKHSLHSIHLYICLSLLYFLKMGRSLGLKAQTLITFATEKEMIQGDKCAAVREVLRKTEEAEAIRLKKEATLATERAEII